MKTINGNTIPNGRTEAYEWYGNPVGSNGKANPKWEEENLVYMPVVYPMVYPTDEGELIPIKTIRVHHKVVPSLTKIFKAIYNYARVQIKKRDGYDKTTEYYDKETLKWLKARKLDRFGGSYNFRLIRGSKTAVSTHALGISIDLNPEDNELGDATGAMPEWVIDIFESEGWVWGGHWSRPDPMHFQMVSGM